jgi:hypothetical protein
MAREFFMLQKKEIKGRDEMSFDIEKANIFSLNDHTLAKNVAETLEKKYPGWFWAVNVMDGVVTVKSLRISGNWGFVMHADKIDNDYKMVVMAGGEILERFRQKRGKFNNTLYNDLNMDAKGQLDGDYAA